MNNLQFKVDESRCIKCGACVADCPVRVIQKKDAASFPEIPDAKAANCIHCQHCLAVCPVGAISIFGKDPALSRPTKGLTLPTAFELDNLMRARRSIRRFQARDVDPAKIATILSTLGNAPTGCNARELTFHVWSTRAAMDKLRSDVITAIERHRDYDYQGDKLLPRWIAVPAILYRRNGRDEFFRGAPHLLVVSANEADPHTSTPDQDIAATLAYFDLLAQSYRVGTCWCGFLKIIVEHIPEIRGILGLGPKTPFYAMLFGYPAARYARTVQRDDEAKIVYHQ